MSFIEPLPIRLAESGWLPDVLVRQGMRRLLRERLAMIAEGGPAAQAAREQAFFDAIRNSPAVVEQQAANAQHYEVPAQFFRLTLGKHRKYSSCFWGNDTKNLDQAEALALAITCERAGLADGQDILELGCGWGSLSLWMAEHYPHARITGVSNSHGQRRTIEALAAERGLTNLRIITADLVGFDPQAQFDRIVSVECFEHLRNWPLMFSRVASWLRDHGTFFMHVFAHREGSYLFDTEGGGNWMGRHFFTGGMMPADRLAWRCQEHLRLDQHWRWEGTHYGRTARAWLDRLDANIQAVEAALAPARPEVPPAILAQRWRMFYMACEELWNFDHGREWFVSHYRFSRR